jgi:predicted DNA-binding protein
MYESSARKPLTVKAVDSQVMLTVRVEADLERRLADLARATGRTKSHYAREAIQRLLAEKEASLRDAVGLPRFQPVVR